VKEKEKEKEEEVEEEKEKKNEKDSPSSYPPPSVLEIWVFFSLLVIWSSISLR
jgi:hypothetical protein